MQNSSNNSGSFCITSFHVMVYYMHSYEYLIIGGGIAGVSAAEAIRGCDAKSSIGIISDEPHALYSRVLIPAYLKKNIPREKLFLRSVDDFTAKRIDVRFGDEATAVDMARKEVALKSGNSVHFEKLLIAAGGKVKRWGSAVDQHFLYRLQTLDDADRLAEKLNSITSPLVVGSSFIALEFLDIFALRKIPVTVLMRDAYFFAGMIDEEGGAILHTNFEKHGISTHRVSEIALTERQGAMLEVSTKSGKEKIHTDALCVGVGIERPIHFLRGSGIELGERGVRVNEFLETNVPSVWAAGDVAEYFEILRGAHHIHGNWTNAVLQGGRAGLNMAGVREAYSRVPSYSVTNLGFHITAVGDVGSDKETLIRVATDANIYERFFVRNDVLVGAFLINRFVDKVAVTRLIETRTPLTAYRGYFTDFHHDIADIPLVSA